MNIILNKLPNPLPDNTFVGLDSEWWGLNSKQLHRPTSGRFAALTICPNDEDVYVITDENLVEIALGRVDNCVWCFHNARFDIRLLRTFVEIPPRTRLWDTYLIERILWNGFYQHFGLDHLVRRYLDEQLDKSLQTSFEDQEEMSQEQLEYAARDALDGRRVALAQKDIITPAQFKSWMTIDAPCMWAVMDFCGLHLDKEKWLKLAETNKQRQLDIDAELPFNPRSPKQVKEFFDKELDMQLKSTGAEILKKLEGTSGWKFASKILESRKYSKRASTYGVNFVNDFVEYDEDGLAWIYSDFNPIGAETFRMSSRNPNAQNQPARDTLEFRECYTAPPNHKMIVADWKSQEPRITAEITKDPDLIQIFRDDKDVYTEMQIVYVKMMNRDDPGRSVMKDIFLGMTYGLTKYGMSKRYGMPKKDAGEFLDAGHKMFPVTSRRMEEFGKQRKKVTTLTGRTIWLNPYSYQVSNNGRNSPIQSVAADQMKLSIARLHRQQMKDYGKCFIAAPVHDELVLIVPSNLSEKVKNEVEKTMQTVAEEICPHLSFPVDVKVCDNWAQGK